jgi:hypothetical protein
VRAIEDENGAELQSPVICEGGGGSASVPRVARTPPKIGEIKRLGNQIAVAIEPAEVSNVFGVDDADLAFGLLRQLIGFLHADPERKLDPAVVNEALALITEIKPCGAIEAMTATMLVGAHRSAFDALRRASYPNQTPAGRALYQSLALKAMRTYAQLVDTLHLGRGKAARQEINVTHQHVVVESGGQATVGAINARRGRG